MNLRFIEAQKERQIELKRLADIRAEELKKAVEAAGKLADMQRDAHRQWMVSTPTDYNAEYQALFGNSTPTAYIHPISGEPIRRPAYPGAAVRGTPEVYNHLDVEWNTTLPPTPRYGTGSRDRDNEYRTVIREINLYIDNCVIDLRIISRSAVRDRIERYMIYLRRENRIQNFRLEYTLDMIHLTWVFAGDSTTFTEHRDLRGIR